MKGHTNTVPSAARHALKKPKGCLGKVEELTFEHQNATKVMNISKISNIFIFGLPEKRSLTVVPDRG